VRHPRPTLVLSKCLELEACRYNGQRVQAPFVKAILPFVEPIAVCPEVEIGLGVPRDPIRLVILHDGVRLVQPSTRRDLTKAMRQFSDRFLDSLGAVDGFILKGRSPSCGIADTKVFDSVDADEPTAGGAGVFAHAVLQRYPRAAIIDEAQLTADDARHRFLVQLFANARAGTRAGTPDGPYPRELRQLG